MKFEESVAYRKIEEFRFPRYKELPSMDLYLEQLVEVLNNIFIALYDDEKDEDFITNAMVSNYVKRALLISR